MNKKTPKYLLYNNQLLPVDEPVMKNTNRSFRYGDGLFETIRLINGQLHLFEPHIERLFNGIEFLKIQTPAHWGVDFFEDKIYHLLEKNNITGNGRIRLAIFRSDGGYYTPRTNKGDYVIEAEEHNLEGYPLNKKGLKVDIYSEMEKTPTLYSNFKTSSALVYVLASIYRKESELDDCLLVNSKNRVAEAISSNVFLVKGGEVFTPPLSEGCVAGVMRGHIMNLMEKSKIEYHEAPILLEELFEAEEIFLTDTIKGIRWVGSYKVKRYNLSVARKLTQALNRQVKRETAKKAKKQG